MPEPVTRPGNDHWTVWDLVSERLQAELPRQSYLTWFRPLEPLSYDGETLTLQVPSQFYCDWIESHYAHHLRVATADALGHAICHKFVVSHNGKVNGRAPVDTPPISLPVLQPVEPQQKPSIKVSGPNESFESRLNERYLFSNFVEGDCNRFARAAALAVADAPGKTPFNPLMIYGGSGLGKTHLIQAIGNTILARKSARRVIYVTSEQFTAEFIKSIQGGKLDAFNRLYRSVDVLLLDDVQFFMTKEKTQEEFFHTFNYLHHAGKQLVFSSDRPPRDLEGFDSRLVSRLQWGLVSEMTIPEYETRLAILRRRAEEEKIELDDDVAQFLALHITDNIRTLQGALIHMLAQASLMGKTISISLAKEVIKNLISKADRIISVERIQALVAEEYGFPNDLIRSKTRKKEIAEARQIAMFLCTEFTRLTLKAIGLHFGGRDHATVIHARETVNERIKIEKAFADIVERLHRKLELASI